MTTKIDKTAALQQYTEHTCGECANQTPVMRPNTLTVHGRRPTLGECPHWTKSRCVLLSQRACDKFKMKKPNI